MSEAFVGLITLTLMEIVLGIDNIVFISVITGKLPESQRPLAWRTGLSLAMLMRIALLLTLTWVLGLTAPVFTLEQLGVSADWVIPHDVSSPELQAEWEHFWEELNVVSWRDLILLGGGLFLVAKSVREIHHELEATASSAMAAKPVSFASVLIQIGLLDIIFSLDSVITAVGMVSRDKLWVMITAVILSIAVMVLFASRIGAFVQRHPTVKMLALSFLILIGVMLIAEGVGTHIDKRYVYFAMIFAVFVELLNMRHRRRHEHPGELATSG